MSAPDHDEFKIAELLCARLCHDLAGPVGAAAAGAELLEETGGDGETLGLVADSAAGAAARLKFLRAAFAPTAKDQPPAAIRDLVESYLKRTVSASSAGLVLAWRVDAGELSADLARLIVNVVLIGRDALSRGGTITIAAGSGRGARLTMTASGDVANLDDEARAVLVDGRDASGPRGAQAVLTRQLAARAGGTLSVRADSTRVELRLEDESGDVYSDSNG